MIDAEGFRANVGIVICNNQGQVFWARRYGQHSWQFPQGGVDDGVAEVTAKATPVANHHRRRGRRREEGGCWEVVSFFAPPVTETEPRERASRSSAQQSGSAAAPSTRRR